MSPLIERLRAAAGSDLNPRHLEPTLAAGLLVLPFWVADECSPLPGDVMSNLPVGKPIAPAIARTQALSSTRLRHPLLKH